MNKKLIRLTESDLHRIVKESVKKILKESRLKSNLNLIPSLNNSYGLIEHMGESI